MRKDKNTMLISVVVLLTIGATMSAAQAEGAKKGAVSNPKWKEECGACHFAFPPHLLPAASWRAIMSNLDNHFGSNATMDENSVTEITAFLEKNASTKNHEVLAKPLLRITETHWFKSEHKEVAMRDWKNPKVKSPANCTACHTKADIGDFDEDNVRIPK
jgi:hypothetical protein